MFFGPIVDQDGLHIVNVHGYVLHNIHVNINRQFLNILVFLSTYKYSIFCKVILERKIDILPMSHYFKMSIKVFLKLS